MIQVIFSSQNFSEIFYIYQLSIKSLQKTMQKLKCHLCENKFNKPSMCPHCSEVFCFECIKGYLNEKHFCPTCDNYIIDLVSCERLIEQIEQKFSEKTQQKQNKNTLCKYHSLPLEYFCRECEDWICSDCGVIDQKHRDHRISPKKELVQESKQIIREEMVVVDEHIYRTFCKKQKSVLDLEFYVGELKWCKKQLHDYFKTLIQRAEKQANSYMLEIQHKIQEYDEKIQKLKERKQELNTMLNSSSVYDRSMNPFEEQSEVNMFVEKVQKLTVMEEIFPEFLNFTYQFSYVNFKNDLYHYSDMMSIWGQDWRLKIYPNGKTGAQGKFMSVFLELANGHYMDKSKKYFYRIELLNLNKAGETIVKEYCSRFVHGDCWGYEQFIPLQKLEDYLHEGTLIFSLGVRNDSYAGLSQDLKRHINKIEKQNKILEKIVCENESSQKSIEKKAE